MKHHEAIELIPQIQQALEDEREVSYHQHGQILFTVVAIYGGFLDVKPVDNSDNFSITLTNPKFRRDCFYFLAKN